MPVINLSQQDIAKSKTVEAGWYPSKIVKVHDGKASADKGSINYQVDFLIKTPAVDGKVIEHMFNSKALGMTTPLLEACGISVAPGQVNLDDLLNKEPDVKLFIDIYQGRNNNKIEGWAPKGLATAGGSGF